MADVTDATFETAVLARSEQVPVVVDLWASWCGPCRTLGPILEQVIAETEGQVELAKVDIDANPGVAQAFGVQSIPLVVAIRDRQAVDQFLGAQPEHVVRDWVAGLLPSGDDLRLRELLEAGDEASLEEALALAPADEDVVVALAGLRVEQGRAADALDLLERIPETPQTRHLAALARAGDELGDAGDLDGRLTELLGRVKGDDDARQEFLDLLELLGPDDPRTAEYRKRLTAVLF